MTGYLYHSIFAEHVDIPPVDISLVADEARVAEMKAFWPDVAGACRILLAPQGSMASRQIPPVELAALLNSLDKGSVEKSTFLLCRTQGSETYLNELRSLCGTDIHLSLSDATDLRQYLALVAAADLVIAVDSGSAHLACAFKRPLLSFFVNYPENIRKWMPAAAQGVPNLMVIADLPEGSMETRSFPQEEARQWLNRQLAL